MLKSPQGFVDLLKSVHTPFHRKMARNENGTRGYNKTPFMVFLYQFMSRDATVEGCWRTACCYRMMVKVISFPSMSLSNQDPNCRLIENYIKPSHTLFVEYKKKCLQNGSCYNHKENKEKTNFFRCFIN